MKLFQRFLTFFKDRPTPTSPEIITKPTREKLMALGLSMIVYSGDGKWDKEEKTDLKAQLQAIINDLI